jgi:hypothetical protein
MISAKNNKEKFDMATTTSRRRPAKCVECGTVSIFPGWAETLGARPTGAIRHCPVCGHQFETANNAVKEKSPDAKRIEEFFSRFC